MNCRYKNIDTLEHILKKAQLSFDENTPMPLQIEAFSRDMLVQMFKELHFTVGVEIGTGRGRFAQTICKALPEAKLYTIDPWTSSHLNTNDLSRMERVKANAYTRLKDCNCEIIEGFSHDVAASFVNGSLDFVYVDGNHHYEYVLQDLEDWSPKVRSGGIIAGHDYERYTLPNSKNWNVVDAVNSFTRTYNIRPWFVFGRIPGTMRYRNCPRSYMWVKK